MYSIRSGLLRKLPNMLPRPPNNFYKSFIRLHIAYGHIIYVQTCNVSLHQKLESVQYNTALAIPRASAEKLYHELSLESLETRRKYRQLSCFYKVSRLSHLDIYSTLFLHPEQPVLQEMKISYLISILTSLRLW